jgi:hypothetical protein
MLAEWGFLAEPDLPDRPGPALLLVALRDAPTLRHFDPELVEYWDVADGHGRLRTIERSTRLPIDTAFSWGWIRITDRLGVTNEYVTFGGHLTVAEIDRTTIAAFTSDAPILRRGGHSQPWDRGADALAAFFGRLIADVDRVPGFEARLAALEPMDRYAAFIADLVGRYRPSSALRDRDPDLWILVRAEADRLARDQPAAWATGTALAREVDGPA